MFKGIDAGSWGEIIVGAIGIFLAIAIYRWSKRRPRLGYRIETKHIIRIHGVDTNELSIRFKGHQVKTLVLCTVTIKNFGTFPIKKDDWQRPLALLFPSNVEILDIRLPLTSPEDLGVEVSGREEKNIKLAPLLLNQGDGFAIEFLITEDYRPTISARIFDVEKIEEFDAEGGGLFSLVTFIASILAGISAGVLSATGILSNIKSIDTLAGPMTFILAVAPLFILIFLNLFDGRRQMKLNIKKSKYFRKK